MARNALKKPEPEEQLSPAPQPDPRNRRGPLVALLLVSGVLVFCWVAFLLALVLRFAGLI